MKEFQFDFERLQVYQKALILIDEVFNLMTIIPKEYRFSIGDNLIRAALSVANNLAEGNDQPSAASKARFYEYASNSARECASVMIVLDRRRLISEEYFWKVKNHIREITSMIKALKKSI